MSFRRKPESSVVGLCGGKMDRRLRGDDRGKPGRFNVKAARPTCCSRRRAPERASAPLVAAFVRWLAGDLPGVPSNPFGASRRRLEGCRVRFRVWPEPLALVGQNQTLRLVRFDHRFDGDGGIGRALGVEIAATGQHEGDFARRALSALGGLAQALGLGDEEGVRGRRRSGAGPLRERRLANARQTPSASPRPSPDRSRRPRPGFAGPDWPSASRRGRPSGLSAATTVIPSACSRAKAISRTIRSPASRLAVSTIIVRAPVSAILAKSAAKPLRVSIGSAPASAGSPNQSTSERFICCAQRPTAARCRISPSACLAPPDADIVRR